MQDPCDIEIGRRLRMLRQAAGKTLAEVAGASGLTHGMLSRFERGDASLTPAKLVRICKHLDVSPSSILAEVDTVVRITAGDGPGDLRALVHGLLRLDDRRAIASLLALLRSWAERDQKAQDADHPPISTET